MHEFMTPAEIKNSNRFWENEKKLSKVAQDAIRGFDKIQPHDLFGV